MDDPLYPRLRCGHCALDFTAKRKVTPSVPMPKHCSRSCSCAASAQARARAALARQEEQGRACLHCKASMVGEPKQKKYCSLSCFANRLGKTVDAVCLGCGKAFRRRPAKDKRKGDVKYCSRACSQLHAAFRLNENRHCVWIAKHCAECGQAWGARQEWKRCQSCDEDKRESRRLAAVVAKAQAEQAKHEAKLLMARAQGHPCDGGCGAILPRENKLRGRVKCDACKGSTRKAAKGKAKAKRRARARIEAQAFDPMKVFARDGWKCRLCGARTPRALRGTYQPNAPELDHIVPLALGGSHTPGNCQLACRSCNGRKGTMARGQVGFDFL